MILLQLFLAFFRIGLFSFGGGYAAMPLIQSSVIDQHQWISTADFADLITISQMTPGPIAVNAATFIGLQIAGIPGAVAATIGVVLPSCIVVSILAVLYTRFRKLSVMQDMLRLLRPAVVALILTADLLILVPTIFRDGAVHFSQGNVDLRMLAWFLLALFLLKKKWDPIIVMLLCGALELLFRLVFLS